MIHSEEKYINGEIAGTDCSTIFVLIIIVKNDDLFIKTRKFKL